MRPLRILPMLFALLLMNSIVRADAKFLTDDDVNAAIATIKPPPADTSEEHGKEVKALLNLQDKRTDADVAWVKSDNKLDHFLFADVLGAWFNKSDLPLTAQLLDDLGADADAVVKPAKKQFNRSRPYLTDARLKPVFEANGKSYPSGHSTLSMSWGLVLAELIPDQKAAIIARADKVGMSREEAGVHYPSDVEAGHLVASEVFKRLMEKPAFKQELEAARKEIASAHHVVSGYLSTEDIDALVATIAPPPADDSPEHKAELQKLLDMQAKRTDADVEWVKRDAGVNGFTFADVLGDWFNKTDLPETAKFLSNIDKATRLVVASGKDKFKRDRPFVADKEIHNALPEHGFSYPSGHGTGSMTYALVLAELFPEHKDALVARAGKVGESREEAGVHYPSDVDAGQKLAAEIVKRLNDNPRFKADMEKATAEIHADAHAVH